MVNEILAALMGLEASFKPGCGEGKIADASCA